MPSKEVKYVLEINSDGKVAWPASSQHWFTMPLIVGELSIVVEDVTEATRMGYDPHWIRCLEAEEWRW